MKRTKIESDVRKIDTRSRMELERLRREVDLLRSPTGYLYAGTPKFKALFGRDSLISGWELLEWDPDFAFSALRELSRLQGKKMEKKTGEYPGKVPHEYYDSDSEYASRKKEIPWLPRGPNYFSVDATPLFVIVAFLLYKREPAFFSPDLRYAVEESLNFLVRNSENRKLLVYEKAVPGLGLQSQSWRDGIGDMLDRLNSPIATIGVQGYLYAALNFGLRFLENDETGNTGLANSIKELIPKISRKLEDNFWIEDSSYFALAVDDDGVTEAAVTSDPGHLLFSGILSRERERAVVNRLFEDDMLTDYGIRSLSALDKRFDSRVYQRGAVWPHDNWIISQGLKARGYNTEYREIRERLLEAYERIGIMPEYFGVDRNGNLLAGEKMRVYPCYPQAWSTGAIINFLTDSGNEYEIMRKEGDKRNGDKA